MSYQNNIPQLRFAGFEGEWKTCLLSDVTKYIKGYAFKSEDYQDDGVRIIRVSDLSSDSIKNDVEKVYIDEIKSKIYDKYKLRKGNIVVTTVGSKPEMLESAVGRGIFINNKNEGLLNQNMLKFENIKNVDNGFIIGLINTKRYQHYMKSIARGNANQANITVVDLLQYEISFPPLPEQQKIASFLSAVDEKIQQLSRKKELLEQYKKGVMQQLFSGKLRFKGENGEDYADWEEKKLGDVCKLNPKNSLLPSSFIYIDLESVDNGQLLKETRIHLSEAPSRAQRLLSCEDILFQMVRPYQKNNLFFNKNGEYVASTGYAQLRATESSMFLYQLIHTTDFVNKVIDRCTGTSYPAINSTDLSNIEISIPSQPEQQKIANFLLSIDTKIENVNGEIGKTQLFKKGLLQQMFV
jgi:type I restriction enzyme S subunit